MMVRSTTSALAAAAAFAALLAGGTAASAQEPGPRCGETTAVAANAQVALDAKEAELVNLRTALELAQGGDDEQAIADARAAVDAAVGQVAGLEADLRVAVGERDEACAEQPTPAPTTPAPSTTPNPPAQDGGSSIDGQTGGPSGGFGQTDPDDVPTGAADTGGR